MYNQNIWYGKEVEGRLSDLQTVFVRKGSLPPDHIEYPHIYFTIEYIREACNSGEAGWNTIHRLLDTRKIVTIEADKDTVEQIPMSVFNKVHILYRIHDPYLERLKKTDTLSIDAGWYRCHQIMKCNLQQIVPDDYKFDYQ
jgi:hypothetical protein